MALPVALEPSLPRPARRRYSLPCGLLGLMLLGPTQAQQAAAPPALRCQLGVAALATGGQPVLLRFDLRNTGTVAVQVLIWGTPFDGWFAPFVQLQRDGVPLPYQGPTVKRGDPTADDYLPLAAGQSRRVEIDLAEAFDLRTPGAYRLTPQIVLHDVVAQAMVDPRPRAQHQRWPLNCPVLSFVVRATPP